MPSLLLYYAHPGHQHSRANRRLFERAEENQTLTTVDLYAKYPRLNIDVDAEQELLIAHDIIVFQFPLFWYSSPALIKQWLDLVLEHGFAYGTGGDKLKGKTMMLAVTAAGPEDAYTKDGYQHHDLRTFLTPFEQTAGLCQMNFPPPYVLYGSLQADDAKIEQHVDGYEKLLNGLTEGALSADNLVCDDCLDAHLIRTIGGA